MIPLKVNNFNEMKDIFLKQATEEAKISLSEGGIPVGSILVIDNKIVGKGHNRRVQKGSPILHAEMDCLENAGRLKPEDYAKAILYTTLSPCDMCSGAILLYKIPKVIIGENTSFLGAEKYLTERGVEVVVVNDLSCFEMMQKYIIDNKEIWNEDIGMQQ
jgi:cytosine/creatinine deaminase